MIAVTSFLVQGIRRIARSNLFQHVLHAVLHCGRNGMLGNFNGLVTGRTLAGDLVAEGVGLAGGRWRNLLWIGEQRIDGLLIGRRQIGNGYFAAALQMRAAETGDPP